MLYLLTPYDRSSQPGATGKVHSALEAILQASLGFRTFSDISYKEDEDYFRDERKILLNFMSLCWFEFLRTQATLKLSSHLLEIATNL